MHHDIDHAARHLVYRKGKGQLRIHNRKSGAHHIKPKAALDAGFLIGKHGRIAHFAAGRRNGQHRADRRAARGFSPLCPEIPEIDARVGQRKPDGLGGVDDAAASDRQDKIRAESGGFFGRMASE